MGLLSGMNLTDSCSKELEQTNSTEPLKSFVKRCYEVSWITSEPSRDVLQKSGNDTQLQGPSDTDLNHSSLQENMADDAFELSMSEVNPLEGLPPLISAEVNANP